MLWARVCTRGRAITSRTYARLPRKTSSCHRHRSTDPLASGSIALSGLLSDSEIFSPRARHLCSLRAIAGHATRNMSIYRALSITPARRRRHDERSNEIHVEACVSACKTRLIRSLALYSTATFVEILRDTP